MTGEDAARRRLDAYLHQVRRGLRGLPAAEALEITEELRSHVIDRSAGADLTEAAVEAALTGLGSARELAGLYVGERMAQRVEANRSPWLILEAVSRLAGLSLRALSVLLVSLAGYGLGLSLLLTALAKPIWPERVGLWIQRGRSLDDMTISLGRTGHPIGPEVLGWWVIPLGLVVGGLLSFLTWRFGLAAVRRLGRACAQVLSQKG
jgi:hypothetical protein